MKGLFLENGHVEVGINAVADFAAGDVESDIVSMKNHGRVVFLCHWGVGTTGVVALTVDACDDVSATNTAKVPFWYRKITAAGAPGTLTRADKDTGVSNTAGSNQVIAIEVLAEDLAALGYSYVRLNVNETTADPLLGGVLALMLDPRHAGGTPASAVV
jgi:hypothetical protein